MSDKSVSEKGNFGSEAHMQGTALTEAKSWFDTLMEREFRGRGDREKSARGRLAKKLGVPETWLKSLQYRSQEKRSVNGDLYRALMIAHRKYEELCERNEAAADRYKAERLSIRGNHEKTHEEPASAGLGMAAPKNPEG